MAGLSQSVLALLTSRIQSLLTSHATESSGQHETFRLVSMVSHVGVAVWVFARAATLGSRLGRVQETALGLGFQPLGMGNKGAVGSRVFINRGEQEACWESFTYGRLDSQWGFTDALIIALFPPTSKLTIIIWNFAMPIIRAY